MPAEFSSLTAAEQQALMDASMSGQKSLKGWVDLMRQRFLEFLLLPKVLNPCDSPKKAGPSEIKKTGTIFWVSMRKNLVYSVPNSRFRSGFKDHQEKPQGEIFPCFPNSVVKPRNLLLWKIYESNDSVVCTLTGVRVAGKLEVKLQWFSLLFFPEKRPKIWAFNPKQVFDSQLSTHDLGNSRGWNRSDMTDIKHAGFE